jgi:hypothetical protein
MKAPLYVCVWETRGEFHSFSMDLGEGGRGLYVRMPSSERPSWTRDFDRGHKYRSATLAGALLFECICFRVDLALASRKILASHILCGHWSHLFDSDSLSIQQQQQHLIYKSCVLWSPISDKQVGRPVNKLPPSPNQKYRSNSNTKEIALIRHLMCASFSLLLRLGTARVYICYIKPKIS